jgi:hypothetical protein
MKITSTAKMNCLYWITSLQESEQGVTRRVWEDLEAVAGQRQLAIKKFSPTSTADFFAAMDQIASDAQAGMLPMIHLDTHGSAERGILIAATGEYVSWEAVAGRFRLINGIVGNNLCVISSTCFSFHVVKEIDVKKASPFFILLAPECEIMAGDIEENVIGFYRDMLNESDILTAQERWFPTQLRVFHCERMLAIVLARYINDAAVGKQKERRKEHLITMAVKLGIPASRQNLRAMRKLAEKGITPTEALIDRFMPTFLAGKRPGFTIAALKTMVEKARANGIKPEGPYA